MVASFHGIRRTLFSHDPYHLFPLHDPASLKNIAFLSADYELLHTLTFPFPGLCALNNTFDAQLIWTRQSAKLLYFAHSFPSLAPIAVRDNVCTVSGHVTCTSDPVPPF